MVVSMKVRNENAKLKILQGVKLSIGKENDLIHWQVYMCSASEIYSTEIILDICNKVFIHGFYVYKRVFSLQFCFCTHLTMGRK